MSKQKINVTDESGNPVDPRTFLKEGEFYNTPGGGAFAIIPPGAIPGANDFPPAVHVDNDDIPVYMGDTKVISAKGVNVLYNENGRKAALIFISDSPFEIGNVISQDGTTYAVMSVTDYGLVTATNHTIQRVEKENFENE